MKITVTRFLSVVRDMIRYFGGTMLVLLGAVGFTDPGPKPSFWLTILFIVAGAEVLRD